MQWLTNSNPPPRKLVHFKSSSSSTPQLCMQELTFNLMGEMLTNILLLLLCFRQKNRTLGKVILPWCQSRLLGKVSHARRVLLCSTESPPPPPFPVTQKPQHQHSGVKPWELSEQCGNMSANPTKLASENNKIHKTCWSWRPRILINTFFFLCTLGWN